MTTSIYIYMAKASGQKSKQEVTEINNGLNLIKNEVLDALTRKKWISGCENIVQIHKTGNRYVCNKERLEPIELVITESTRPMLQEQALLTIS